MDSTDVKLLMEAYSAVYDEDLRTELEDIDELEEDFAFIDDLSDEELNIVMEEILFENYSSIDSYESLIESLEIYGNLIVERSDSLATFRREVQSRRQFPQQAAELNKKRKQVERVDRIKGALKTASDYVGGKIKRAKTLGGGVSSAVQGGARDLPGKVRRGAGYAQGKAYQAVDRARTLGGGISSAVQGGARDLGTKLSQAKEKIKKGLKRIKSELSGEAATKARQQKLVRQTRRNISAARKASVDTSEFERPKPSGPATDLSKAAERLQKFRQKTGSPTATQSDRRITHVINRPPQRPVTTYSMTGTGGGGARTEVGRPAARVRGTRPSTSGTTLRTATGVINVPLALPPVSSLPATRRKPGEEFKQSTSAAEREWNRRVARETSKRTRETSKRTGMPESLEILLPYILEDIIAEGYADSYDEAYEILESLSDYDFEEIVESYIEENVESYDFYDVVLEHLIHEGYADSVENAEVIMANMSEEWVDDILEVTGGGHIPQGGTTYGSHRSPAQKRFDKFRGTPYRSGEGTLARLERGKKEAGIRSSYAPGSREENPSRTAWGSARSPEGSSSGLAMSPEARMTARAKALSARGETKRANTIERVRDRPPAS